jgi:hypothetical protein
MNDLVAGLARELSWIALFFKAIFVCGFYTGLIVVPLVLIGYESWKRKA